MLFSLNEFLFICTVFYSQLTEKPKEYKNYLSTNLYRGRGPAQAIRLRIYPVCRIVNMGLGCLSVTEFAAWKCLLFLEAAGRMSEIGAARGVANGQNQSFAIALPRLHERKNPVIKRRNSVWRTSSRS
jgi:hypothetical protein